MTAFGLTCLRTLDKAKRNTENVIRGLNLAAVNRMSVQASGISKWGMEFIVFCV